jgi:hypothetical protein
VFEAVKVEVMEVEAMEEGSAVDLAAVKVEEMEEVVLSHYSF